MQERHIELLGDLNTLREDLDRVSSEFRRIWERACSIIEEDDKALSSVKTKEE